MGKSLVSQFQEDLTSGKKTIQDLLRMARLISAKLGLSDLQQWTKYELDGYPDTASVPEYRSVTASVQYYDDYRGWRNPVGQATYRFWITQAVTEIEVFAERDWVEFNSPHRASLVSLYDGQEITDAKQRFIISGSEMIRILGTVKSELLDWSIELEQRGILGENMAFNEKEKDSAKHQTFNIQNVHGVVGDVTGGAQINVYDYSSFHQMLKENGVPQSKRNELENLIDELKNARPENKKTAKSKILEWIKDNAASLGTLAVELTRAFHGQS